MRGGKHPWVAEALLALERSVAADGSSALHLAVELGNGPLFSYVMALLAVRDFLRQLDKRRFAFKPARTVMEMRDNQQATPLLLSAKRNQQRMLEELVANGAQLYA